MRYSSDLLFAGNEHHTCVWRAVGGQRWTTVTSILVVVWITSVSVANLDPYDLDLDLWQYSLDRKKII